MSMDLRHPLQYKFEFSNYIGNNKLLTMGETLHDYMYIVGNSTKYLIPDIGNIWKPGFSRQFMTM